MPAFITGFRFRLNLALFGLLLLTACTYSDPVNMPLPSGQPKLVVSGFISPEVKGVKITITKSRVLYGTDTATTSRFVEDATVLLSDGFNTFELPYAPWDMNYADTTIIIVPGRTYSLTVTAPGDFKVTASCTVPLKTNTSITASLDSSTFQPDSDVPDYIVETTWKDLPGEGDFYRASVFLKLKSPDPTDTVAGYYGQPMEYDGLARDFQADGRGFRINSTPIFMYREYLRSDILKGYYIYLLTTDRHYYEYHQSLFRFAQAFEFEEKPRIYTNIEGGLGIFAAYRSYRTELKH